MHAKLFTDEMIRHLGFTLVFLLPFIGKKKPSENVNILLRVQMSLLYSSPLSQLCMELSVMHDNLSLK